MENNAVDTFEETPHVKQPPKEKKQTVRILFQKKCPKCTYLFPWAEKMFNCISDPDCPATRMEVVVGRDPEKVISRYSKEFALAIFNADEEAFSEAFKKMVRVSEEGEVSVHPNAFEIFSTVVEKFVDLTEEETDAQVAGL